MKILHFCHKMKVHIKAFMYFLYFTLWLNFQLFYSQIQTNAISLSPFFGENWISDDLCQRCKKWVLVIKILKIFYVYYLLCHISWMAQKIIACTNKKPTYASHTFPQTSIIIIFVLFFCHSECVVICQNTGWSALTCQFFWSV